MEGGERTIGKGQTEVDLENAHTRNCDESKRITSPTKKQIMITIAIFNILSFALQHDILRERFTETREKLIPPSRSFLPGSVPDGRGGYRERKGNGREWYRDERRGGEPAREKEERNRERGAGTRVRETERPSRGRVSIGQQKTTP